MEKSGQIGGNKNMRDHFPSVKGAHLGEDRGVGG